MLPSSASGKQVLSRLEWALEDEAGQDAGLPLPSPGADLQRKAWVELLGSPTHGQQLGEPLRLPELGQRGFLQMHLSNASASAGLFQKAGAGFFCQALPVQVRKVRWFFPPRGPGMSVPAMRQNHGPANALGCSVPLRCGLVAPAGGFCLHKSWHGAAAQDTVVSCQTCAGICSRLFTPQKEILKAPTKF